MSNDQTDKTKLDEIKARLKAATPGPWHIEGSHEDYAITGPGEYGAGALVLVLDARRDNPSSEDADLIAHAPADIAALLAEVDRLTAWLVTADDLARLYDESIAALEARAVRAERELQCELGKWAPEGWVQDEPRVWRRVLPDGVAYVCLLGTGAEWRRYRHLTPGVESGTAPTALAAIEAAEAALGAPSALGDHSG